MTAIVTAINAYFIALVAAAEALMALREYMVRNRYDEVAGDLQAAAERACRAVDLAGIELAEVAGDTGYGHLLALTRQNLDVVYNARNRHTAEWVTPRAIAARAKHVQSLVDDLFE